MNRFQFLRKILQISQKEIAHFLGVTQQFWSYLEKGVRKPSEQTIYVLEKELGISREWLETGKGSLFSDWQKGLKIIKNKAVLNRYELDFLVEVMQSVWYSSKDFKTNQNFIFNMIKAISYIVENCNVINLKEMGLHTCWGAEIPTFSYDIKQTLNSVEQFLITYPEASNTTLADWTSRALVQILRDGDFEMTEKDEKTVSELLLPWSYYVALASLNKEREKISSAWFENLEFLYKDKSDLQITNDDIPKNINEEKIGVYILCNKNCLNKALEEEDSTGAYTIDLKDRQIYIEMTIYDLVEFMLLLKTIPDIKDIKENKEHQVGGFILTLTPATKYPYALRKVCSGFIIMINFTQEQFTKLKQIAKYFENHRKFMDLAFRLYIEKYGFV